MDRASPRLPSCSSGSATLKELMVLNFLKKNTTVLPTIHAIPDVLDAPSSPEPDLTANDAIWNEFVTAIKIFHHDPDIEAARVIYSGVAAHELNGAPVWPMPIAPPGSGKGVALDNLQGLDKIHFIDELTSKTFLSGHMPDPSQPAEK